VLVVQDQPTGFPRCPPMGRIDQVALLLQRARQPQTGVVIPVLLHATGVPADMEAVGTVAEAGPAPGVVVAGEDNTGITKYTVL